MDSLSKTCEELTENFAAERVHGPGSPGYEAATRLWNGAVTHRPAIAVQPTSHADVQTAVRFARERDIPISVRGGGHDWAGRCLVDDGLVVDMSLMRRVIVDKTTAVATVAGGATAADVIAATEPHGLAAATGMVGQVGMVGLTVGGGYGPLNGIAGLAIDNLIGAELVLADGSAVAVDARTHSDLLWALRGGGGNFGVVTAMHIRLHPVSSVTAGVILFPWHQAAHVMRGYAALVPGLPDEFTVQIGIVSGPDGKPVVYLSPSWSGKPTSGPAWIDKLLHLGTPILVQVADMPYSGQLHLLDSFIEGERHCEMRTRTMRSISDGAIDALVRAGDTRTSGLSGIVVHHFHGASTRVPRTRTPFGIREPHHMVELMAAWNPAEDGTAHRRWVQTVYEELEPHAIAGGYPSMIGPGQAAQADAAYGPNASRLSALKRRWDPDNVFSATTLPSNAF